MGSVMHPQWWWSQGTDSPQFQVHSKQLQMHGSDFSAISQYMEMTLGYDKEHKWRWPTQQCKERQLVHKKIMM